MPFYKEIITQAEIDACQIGEEIRVLDLVIAFEILRMNVCELHTGFYSQLHKELLHHILQRGSMAEKILVSPNICAELFTVEQINDNQRYVINKLVGRRDFEGRRQEDFDCLYRQTLRKLLKLTEDVRQPYLVFFWNREPNLILFDGIEWRFHPNSPAYKSLVSFYGKFNLARNLG